MRFIALLLSKNLFFFGKEYAVNRAYLGTFTAGDTFFVIYYGNIVFNVNSIRRAVLFALSAGDTAVCTFLANDGTFFFVTTHNGGFRARGNEGDDALRAGLYAKPASDAKLFVYPCNAVFNAYGVFGAYSGAIPASRATVDAGFGAAVDKTFRFTAFNSFVNGFVLCRL